MDGHGRPIQTTRRVGKPVWLVPRAALWFLFLARILDATADGQQIPFRNPTQTRPPLSLAQESRVVPISEPSSLPEQENGLTGVPASGSADNPAENANGSSVLGRLNPVADSRPVLFKFTMGGEKPVRWEGYVRLQSRVPGSWANLSLLSIEPKSVGSIRLDREGREISIRHSDAVAYNSFQVECHPTPDAQLEIQLRSPDNPQWSFYQTVSLAQLIEAPWSLPLSNSGHGIWVERPSQDQIHIESSLRRDILELGEAFDIVVTPNRLQVGRGSALKYHARITNLTAGNKLVWEDRGDLAPDLRGEYKTLPTINWTAGPEVGVYQLQVDLTTVRSSLTSFLPNSVTGNPTVSTRQFQWVVVPPVSEATSASLASVEAVSTKSENAFVQSSPFTIHASQFGVSAARPFEIQRLPWLPRLQNFQRSNEPTYATRSSETLRTMEVDGQTQWELGSEQWRVIDLPHLEPGLYWIDLELLNATEAQIGLDLVQMDQWNRVPHWTTGSVWTALPDPLFPQVAGTSDPSSIRKTHWRTLHWLNPPDTHPATLLSLTNRSKDTSAKIGSIHVTPVDRNPRIAGPTEPSSRRTVGYYLETPLLTSIFSGRKPNPTATSPPLNDWLSYHDAAERLAQFLVVKNYNCVWLPILKQGGTLFPLDEFQTLPRFENSSFGALAQPNSRFDVVELLLSKLSREGLSMIPVLDLSVRLPRDGDSTIATSNPLDKDYQQEVIQIIEMLAIRYHRHPALRGIAIELSPESPVLFRSETDGMNPQTVDRFLADHSLNWPTAELGNLKDVALPTIEQWVLNHHSDKWLQWRADELTKFFQLAQAKLRTVSRPINHPELDLYLVAAGLHRQPILRDTLFPSLRGRPSWSDHWLKLGLKLEAFQSEDGGISLSVQQTTRQTPDVAKNRRADMTTRGQEFWQVFEKLPELSFLAQQALQQSSVPAMTDTPSDHVGQSMLTFSVASNSIGCEAMWAETLRRQDIRSLANQTGGLPRTEHVGEQQFATAFSQLRDETFTTIYQDSSSPIAIRQTRSRNGKSQVYFVNAAAWPVTCGIDVVGTNEQELLTWKDVVSGQNISAAPLENTGNRLQPAGFVRSTKPTARLTITLAPYSLTALEGSAFNATQVSISETADAANEWLVAVKASLFRRLRQSATKAAPIQSVQNFGFEEELNKSPASAPGAWVHGQLKTGQSITRDPAVAHSGTSSLRIRNSDGVVWLRSNSIATPTTGRLSVTAWLRNDPDRPVESIRLAIDGLGTDGRKYYRYGEIPLRRGANSPAGSQSNESEWQPIAVHFDDLPEEGLSNLRIGFDLMKPGDLWLDSVQCFDRWLDANDQNVLSNRLGLAAFSLESKRNTWAALQTLDDYWLRFLLAYVPDPNETVEAAAGMHDSSPEQRTRNARGRRFLPLR